ncbi:hypothetical protein FQR65_LT19960 [Abscondita terminalis]|nr:hypothetical protein FQR65_LT19960 [Abscondita terminalis]
MYVNEPKLFISGAAQGLGLQSHVYSTNKCVTKFADLMSHNAKAGKLDVRDMLATMAQKALADISCRTEWAQGLKYLINNAGHSLFQVDFEKNRYSKHPQKERLLSIVNGVLNGCHAAFPYLKEAKFARVINLSSASAIYGQADLVSYSASKFAVRGITEGLDIEWQKYGIRVLDVMPLFVQTAMVKDMDAGAIQNIGVSLSPQDVAEQVFAQVKAKGTLFTATHRPVGLKTKVMFTLSAISPQFINRR